MLKFFISFFFLLPLLFLASCQPAGEVPEETNFPHWDGQTLFEALSPEASGVDFANTLSFQRDFNIYTYRNFYNGGGVALGDVNKDGLVDIYFTGNMQPNRLYLNKGDMQFEDVTEAAGVAGKGAWSTGVSMADVNGDGWLDIYVCNSGEVSGDNKKNELFINQQDGTFKEVAEDWGIADLGYGTHGVFFDYDKDGDLDLYLLNNSYQAIGSFNLQKNERLKRDPVGGDKLFRNNLLSADGSSTPSFTDVSEEAGIYGSVIGFGLGVTVGDVNSDGWQDIYVSNDFFERDYLYINQQDGTFQEVLTQQMQSISAASMGADMADINNDGHPDIFVTEMLPEPNARIKTATTFENWNRYQYNLENDYFHQFTRNMLQRNNGNGSFSEIGRLSGVEATDWSWGALIFDMDNDGYKDLFIANGIYQDLTNRDFLDYIADEEVKRSIITKDGVDFKALVDAIPSNPVPNYAYRNLGPEGDYRFEKKSRDFGLDYLGFSNGSAYADLDNDGDLDLVVNNVNATAHIYRNHASQRGNNWLQLSFKGTAANTFALGTRAIAYAQGQQFMLEHMPMRGFESTVDARLHFGLGNIQQLDSLLIYWPDGSQSFYTQVASNQWLQLDQAQEPKREAVKLADKKQASPYLEELSAAALGIAFEHKENRYSDFDNDPLLYHMQSAEGPALCSGDFNGDGRDDFYIGGAKGQPGQLYLSQGDGYQAVKGSDGRPIFAQDAGSEDVACACFDANGDGQLDLYVASGSSEFSSVDFALMDRLYFNQGKGSRWEKSAQPLPSSSRPVVSSTVVAHDIDGDGDIDLFVGGRMRPGLYAAPASSFLLLNDGKGQFQAAAGDGLKDLGMVTAAAWMQLGDGQEALLVAGEWMAPKLLQWQSGTLQDISEQYLPQGLHGWYHTLLVADFNQDGRDDIVLGNHGLNSRFRASAERPVQLYLNDFDQNGKAEPIITTWEGEKAYPMALLHDLTKQMPGLRKQYIRYESFGDQGIEDIFDVELLNRSLLLKAEELRSMILISGKEGYRAQPLPMVAQESPLFALASVDADGDGHLDLITGGNFNYAKPEVGRYAADKGNLLLNDGQGNFRAAEPAYAGLGWRGEIRNMCWLESPGGSRLLLARNNEAPLLFTWLPKASPASR